MNLQFGDDSYTLLLVKMWMVYHWVSALILVYEQKESSVQPSDAEKVLSPRGVSCSSGTVAGCWAPWGWSSLKFIERGCHYVKIWKRDEKRCQELQSLLASSCIHWTNVENPRETSLHLSSWIPSVSRASKEQKSFHRREAFSKASWQGNAQDASEISGFASTISSSRFHELGILPPTQVPCPGCLELLQSSSPAMILTLGSCPWLTFGSPLGATIRSYKICKLEVTIRYYKSL